MPVPEDKLRLGGMALRNGLLVHGPTHWAAAVRTKDGDVKVASGPKPRVTAVDDIPGLRGLVRLGEAFAVIPLVKRGLPEAKLAFENPSVLGVAAGASVGGRAAAPPRAGRRRRAGLGADRARARRCSRCAAASWPPTTASSTRRSPPTRPTTTDARDAHKEHERCGSHLMAPMLAANLAGTLLLKRAVEKPEPARRRRGRARVDGRRGRGLRLDRAPRRLAGHARAEAPGLRAAAADRHARARRAPARGRPRRAGRDPARRGLELGSRPPSNARTARYSVVMRDVDGFSASDTRSDACGHADRRDGLSWWDHVEHVLTGPRSSSWP